MENVTGFGSTVSIIASNSYPVGFPVSQFSNDVDAFDFPSVQMGDFAMGLNGDGIAWSKANPLKGTISVVAGSLDDQNLQVVASNNRVSQGKTVALDIITMTIVYADNTTTTFSNGIMTDAAPAKSFGSDGKLKTRTYGFTFESVIGS
jgi:hypothetical protein